MERRLLIAILGLLLTLPVGASSRNVKGLQSGDPDDGRRIFNNAGIYGIGEIIAVLDTGLDWDGCFFEGPGNPPPVNTVTAAGELETENVDLSRRKVIAYDFLYSCDEFPGSPGCDRPSDPADWDNHGHGSVNAGAAAGDRGNPLLWESGDALATGAKLVIQDGGYVVGGDLCAHRPGFGCPLRDLRTILAQAYAQGARIHTNSWGNRQGAAPNQAAPTANYTLGASQIDDFVHRNRDMVVIFNTGNAGTRGESSLSSPGSAKNTIQVGAFWWNDGFPSLESYSGRGPTRDGRLKPDLVGPGRVVSTFPNKDILTGGCETISETGTSWAAPTIASLAALTREYFSDGYYPTGRMEGEGFEPSAALVKAVLIASTRSLVALENGSNDLPIEPAPTPQQGFGYPVLGDVLPIVGGSAPAILALDEASLDLREGERRTLRFTAQTNGRVRIVLAWSDAPAPPSPSSPDPVLVNDLDLVLLKGDETIVGNSSLTGGAPDRLNNVEELSVLVETDQILTVAVTGYRIRSGESQSAALVVSGDLVRITQRPRPARRR